MPTLKSCTFVAVPAVLAIASLASMQTKSHTVAIESLTLTQELVQPVKAAITVGIRTGYDLAQNPTNTVIQNEIISNTQADTVIQNEVVSNTQADTVIQNEIVSNTQADTVIQNEIVSNTQAETTIANFEGNRVRMHPRHSIFGVTPSFMADLLPQDAPQLPLPMINLDNNKSTSAATL